VIYHPGRNERLFGECTVYFDAPRGNQDPYIWNDAFLHTFCHMTELRNPQPQDINFWVTGDIFPEFNHLFCDLVFVIAKRAMWQDRNVIKRSDPMVDSEFAYNDHYRWVEKQHLLTRRRRVTLKADPIRSFQPQTGTGSLIDVLPIFADLGLSREWLRAAIRKPFGKRFVSKPIPIDERLTRDLYENLRGLARRKLRGPLLRKIRQKHPELESPWRRG
jgi:hypothetical protein